MNQYNRYLSPERGFFTNTRASDWVEGLLLGNGTLGSIVMGHPQKECVMIGHEELFLPLFERLPVLEMASMLPELRELLSAGRGHEANQRVVDAAVQAGYPSDFLMTDPFHPGFDLLVDCGPYAEVSEYRRGVNFETGEAFVRFVDAAGAETLRRAFVSRAHGLLVLECRSDTPINADIRLGARPQKSEPWEAGSTSSGSVPKGSFVQRGFRTVETTAQDDCLTFRAAYAQTLGGYEGYARVLASGGQALAHAGGIRVQHAESVLIVAALTPSAVFEESEIRGLRDQVASVRESYEELLAAHNTIHGDLFARMRLTLVDATDAKNTSVEEHLDRARQGENDPAWLQKVFDACRYNIISSTGTLPPNLQGVWTGTWTPHWSGDYTLDANVQAAVAHYLACGTPELMQSLFRLIDRIIDDSRENARALYGARGVFINSRVSTHGLQQRYNYCPVFFWTAGAPWLAHYYYDYYSYTGDRVFLAEKAVPFMREVLHFFQDFLESEDDGRYLFNPSFSPENRPANGDSLATINATMDIAAVREVARNFIWACRELELEDTDLPSCRELLRRLPPYSANDDGALKEWSTPALQDNYEHRHMSHLYPLYPGDEADPDEWSELYEMCRRALVMRMGHYNPNEYGGFGLYHVAMAAARARDGASAYDALAHMTSRHVYNGMGTSHNSGPTIFNMDPSGGIPAAVVEMLVVSRHGSVELLPAAVGPLTRGRVDRIRCRGGVSIDTMEWDLETKALRCRIQADHDQVLLILLPAELGALHVVAGAVEEAGTRRGLRCVRADLNVARHVAFRIGS